jgi:hypothetical protein
LAPVHTTIHSPTEISKKLASLKVKEIQKLIGRKLTIKERISLLVLKHSFNQKIKEDKQGSTAFGFGIAALAMLIIGLFVPYVILGSLVAAILAIVLGSVEKKRDRSDRKAQAAVLLGWITLGVIALLLIVAAIVVAAWTWY